MSHFYEALALFPTTVVRSNIGRGIGGAELEIIKNLKYRENRSNTVSTNTDVLNIPELSDLKKFVETSLEFYIREVIKSTNIEAYLTQSWVNVTEERQNHHKHHHPNSFLSGVIYIDVDQHADKITFFRKEDLFPLAVDPSEFTVLNSDSWSLDVKTGDLLIFPSSIEHEVPVKRESNSRTSIAFNAFIKGSIGSDHGLTQLKL